MSVSQPTLLELYKIIKSNCIDCMGGAYSEVELCTSPKCKLYAYRFGRQPLETDIKYVGDDKYKRDSNH